jgi:hypothetical protein
MWKPKKKNGGIDMDKIILAKIRHNLQLIKKDKSPAIRKYYHRIENKLNKNLLETEAVLEKAKEDD